VRANFAELVKRLRPRTVGSWFLVSAAVPLAIGCYALYLWHAFGDPLLFMRLQSTDWHRHLVPPWELPSILTRAWQQSVPWGYQQAHMLVDEVPVVFALLLTYGIARRLPLMYTFYMVGVLVTAIAAPVVIAPTPLEAAGRYLLPAVPMYLLLGAWVVGRPWLDQLIVGGGMAIQALLVVFFVIGGKLV
jgi:hypothetical protein